MVEGFRESAEMEKARRRASWEQRGIAIEAIEARGFKVRAMGTDEQHYRIKLSPGRGYVDFWPSTWKWHHKMKGDRAPRHSGRGLKPMTSYLMGIGEPK